MMKVSVIKKCNDYEQRFLSIRHIDNDLPKINHGLWSVNRYTAKQKAYCVRR